MPHRCMGAMLAQTDIEACIPCDEKVACKAATQAKILSEVGDKFTKIQDGKFKRDIQGGR